MHHESQVPAFHVPARSLMLPCRARRRLKWRLSALPNASSDSKLTYLSDNDSSVSQDCHVFWNQELLIRVSYSL
jgi:hypothetical protein